MLICISPEMQNSRILDAINNFLLFSRKRESVITYLCHVVVFHINSQGFEEKGDLMQRFKTENMWF